VTRTEDATLRTVVIAVAANLLIAVAKGVAALLTGSAAMLAETTHSIADTLNESVRDAPCAVTCHVWGEPPFEVSRRSASSAGRSSQR
jgi:hypothetical protein